MTQQNETEKEYCVELSLYCKAKSRKDAIDKANTWLYKNSDKQYQIWVENAGEMLD